MIPLDSGGCDPHHNLKRIAADILSLRESEIWFRARPRLSYQSNNLYEAGDGDQRIVLKEYVKPEEFESSPLREYKALHLLAEEDIAPQPRAFYASISGSNPVVVYEFMEGTMWDRCSPSSAQLVGLAGIWHKVNQMQGDDLWLSRGQEQSLVDIWHSIRQQLSDYDDWAALNFKPARETARLCKEVVEKRQEIALELSYRQVPLCFCRADPRFANVIARSDGRLGLVDWEDSGLRDPARDMADLITHPNQEDLLTWKAWCAFLDPYLEYRSKKDPHLERRFHLYLGLFPLWWISLLVAEGLRRERSNRIQDWRVNELDPNLRLQRYLARAMSWPELDFERALLEVEGVRFFAG